MKKSPNHRNSLGFTLIEVIVVVAVLTLLAGIIVPMVSSVQEDAKVAKILSVVDAVKKACERHYADTGSLATELSNSTASSNHELSITQSTAGWKGPYLDHPLTLADNPFGGTVLLYESFTSGTVKPTGFDLMAASSDSATGAGQYIQFGSIPESVAKAVDKALDKDLDTSNWKTTGRVEYSGTTLMIFLLDA